MKYVSLLVGYGVSFFGVDAYLFADPLAAVLAPDHVLDDGVVREILIHGRNGIQRRPHGEEVDDFVEEDAGG